MANSDDEKMHGRIHGEQFDPEHEDSLLMRLIFHANCPEKPRPGAKGYQATVC